MLAGLNTFTLATESGWRNDGGPKLRRQQWQEGGDRGAESRIKPGDHRREMNAEGGTGARSGAADMH